jgi:hypothetical protein
MTVVAALWRSKTMKKNAKLVLSKETLRALTQGQLPKVDGGVEPTDLSFTPKCFYTDAVPGSVVRVA